MIYEARLVARGFEEENLNNICKDSPICFKDSFHLVLSIIVSNSWINHSLDIKPAFLKGKKFDRDVYLKPPKEAEKLKLWTLNITTYSLCDAPCGWYIIAKDVLMRTSKFEDSVFYWYNNNKLEELTCCHVDDFFWGGTKHFAGNVINRLKEKFLSCSEEFENFKYVGQNLVQKDDLDRRMSKDSPLTTDEARQLRGLAGQLNWTSNQTRPGMSCNACEVSTSIKDAQISDLMNANNNKAKLKSQQILLPFPNLMCVEECIIICFTDAAFTNLKNLSSQGGYIVFLCKNQKKYIPISWKSKKIQRVVKTNIAAETLALQEPLETWYMIRII